MNAIVPFQFDGATVRVVQIDGVPHFVGKDVCERLGYSNPNKAMNDHCRGVTKRYPIVDALGRSQEARVLSEADVLRLVMKSSLPGAQRFERWVFEEVLPSIRKTGSYSVPQAEPDIDVRDIGQLSKIALQLIDVNKELTARAEKAEAEVEEQRPKAEFYDEFAKADGLYGLQNAARVLNQPPNKFIMWLLTEGLLFRHGHRLVPIAHYRDTGVFYVKPITILGKAGQQTFVTPRGIQFLAARLVDSPPVYGISPQVARVLDVAALADSLYQKLASGTAIHRLREGEGAGRPSGLWYEAFAIAFGRFSKAV